MKSKIFYSILIITIIWLSSIFWKSHNQPSDDQLEELRKSIIAADTLTKEADGQYTKLVDYYKSSSDLNNELKSSNKELYDVIKKQNERILNLTTTVVSLKEKVEDGLGKFNPSDSNEIELGLRYPDKEKPFILWDGVINTKTAKYNGLWKFNKLPIQLVVTEESRGLWKHRIVGPDWFIVDSLSVLSLPADEYQENIDRKLQFMLGANYSFSLLNQNSGNIGLGFGVSAFSSHTLLLNANTNRTIGLSYYYKFKSVKRRK